MRTLLATTMVLGAVFTLGTIQPTEATVSQSLAPTYHQSQIIPARYWHHRDRYYDRPYYSNPYYYDEGPRFQFHLGL